MMVQFLQCDMYVLSITKNLKHKTSGLFFELVQIPGRVLRFWLVLGLMNFLNFLLLFLMRLMCLHYTANIFNVIFTFFKCVPLSTVFVLNGLHLIAAPSTVE